MKKIVLLTILLLIAGIMTVNGQKKISSSQIKFEMLSEGMDTSEMGHSFITHAFSTGRQVVDMNLLDGLMNSRIISDEENPDKSRMYIDAYGMKYLITNLSEEYVNNGINIGNLSNTVEITYDEKDKKKILGYKCYKVFLKMETGEVNECYITEKIAHPKGYIKALDENIKGYPLELILTDEGGGKTSLIAVDVQKEITAELFDDLEGYEEMTYEEFEQMMQ
ncbi:MAG: hypothetical protein JXQ23_10095 [Clostridia bacterium]|nr:hypothetical protein [Bacteroidales bacterium]MBN2853071.1 hypothetical protein [Clostridia bacterium]